MLGHIQIQQFIGLPEQWFQAEQAGMHTAQGLLLRRRLLLLLSMLAPDIDAA